MNPMDDIEPAAARDPLQDFFVTREERDLMAARTRDEAFRRRRVTRDDLEVMAFRVADEEYAIPIADIQEIVKVPEITPVPRVHRSVLGIISLRGAIVPLLDLRLALAMPAAELTRKARILVLKADGAPLGLVVDGVSSAVRLRAEAIGPPPATVERGPGELVQGIGRVGERMIIILDVAAVLRLMERRV